MADRALWNRMVEAGAIDGAMVNLLPWRESRRAMRRRRFLVILAVSMLSTLAALFWLQHELRGNVAGHVAERQRLQAELGWLGSLGAEATRLRQEQQEAISHMQVLNGLQRSRPLPAAILAELASEAPDAVRFRRLVRDGNEVRVDGLGESHAAVAELLRRLEASPRFQAARLANVDDPAMGAGSQPGASPPPDTNARASLLEFGLVLQLPEPGA